MKGLMLIDGDYIQLNLENRENCIRYYKDHKKYFIDTYITNNDQVIYFKNKFSSLNILDIRSLLIREGKLEKRLAI